MNVAIHPSMQFPDPSIVPPPDRLSPMLGTVVIVLGFGALLVWTGALIARFARAGTNPDDKPGVGGLIFFVLTAALVTFTLGDVVVLKLLGTPTGGEVTEADGYTVTSRMRGRVSNRTSYVFVRLRDASGVTCADTTTPAAMDALAADPSLRLPFTHVAGLCQVGLSPSVSRAGAGMIAMLCALGLMLAWPKRPKPAAQ